MIVFERPLHELRAELAALREAKHQRKAEIDAGIRSRWPTSASLTRIACDLDCSTEHVRRRAKALGLPARVRTRGHDGLTPEQVETYAFYRRKGFPVRDARAAALEDR